VLDIGYYYLHEFTLDGLDVIVSRTGYTAELGYEIYVRDASRNAMRVWDLIWQAGQPHGLQVIGPCHIRRIEGGILAHGADITFETNPFEVGMGYDWMVSLDKEGDFIGKEALTRIRAEGPSRKLAGVEIAGPPTGSFNDGSMIDVFPVQYEGQRVGEVTSACYSPRLEKNIGYAMVPIELTELGTPLQVDTGTEVTDAVVVAKPFIDPTKEQPKQDVNALVGAGAAAQAARQD